MDWNALGVHAQQHVRRTLRTAPPPTVDDLAREVVVRLFRYSRREKLVRPEELVGTLARVVCRDHVRRRAGVRAMLNAIPDADGPLELPPPDPEQESGVDMLELFRFVVLEHFRQHDPACHELATEFFTEQSWSSVARRMQVHPRTIIRRWSSGMEQIRELAYTQRGPVWEWARAAGLVA